MESLPEPSGPGTVVLDIGGDVGAAAVFVPVALADVEIEIRASGEPWQGTHVAVRERQLPDGVVWAALFPALVEGDYEIRVRGEAGGPTGALEVSGGQVATMFWRLAPGPSPRG